MDGQGAHNHNVRFYGGGTTGTVPSLRFDGGGHVDFATLTNIGNHAHNMSGSTGSGGSHNHSISGSISGSGTLSMGWRRWWSSTRKQTTILCSLLHYEDLTPNRKGVIISE